MGYLSIPTCLSTCQNPGEGAAPVWDVTDGNEEKTHGNLRCLLKYLFRCNRGPQHSHFIVHSHPREDIYSCHWRLGQVTCQGTGIYNLLSGNRRGGVNHYEVEYSLFKRLVKTHFLFSYLPCLQYLNSLNCTFYWLESFCLQEMVLNNKKIYHFI